jgi:glycosyltransferase involved in cell wall biosynthesis
VPIVATAVGACLETLDDGACGSLVAPADPAALAAAIRAHAAGRVEQGRVEAAARRAELVFSRRAMAERYAELLRVAAPRAGGPA